MGELGFETSGLDGFADDPFGVVASERRHPPKYTSPRRAWLKRPPERSPHHPSERWNAFFRGVDSRGDSADTNSNTNG
jgi:hypothetical protein